MIHNQKRVAENHNSTTIDSDHSHLIQGNYLYKNKILLTQKHHRVQNLHQNCHQFVKQNVNSKPKENINEKSNVQSIRDLKLNVHREENLPNPFIRLKNNERKNNASQVILIRNYQIIARIFLLQRTLKAIPNSELLITNFHF